MSWYTDKLSNSNMYYQNDDSSLSFIVDEYGRVGLGIIPSGSLHIKNTSNIPIIISTGIALSQTPLIGSIEYNGIDFYLTPKINVRQMIPLIAGSLINNGFLVSSGTNNNILCISPTTVLNTILPSQAGSSGKSLTSDGINSSWVAGGAASTVVHQIEIDFGSIPIDGTGFLISDASISSNSKLHGYISYESPTNKDLDELEMDILDIKIGPSGNGFALMYIQGCDGYIHDKFKINYTIG